MKKIVITVSDSLYEIIIRKKFWKKDSFNTYHNTNELVQGVKNGKILPEGHWIKETSAYGWDGRSFQCSVCGRSIHLGTQVENLDDYPYCHCGAKMPELENSNA